MHKINLIFLGVVSSPKSSSNSIRNKQLVDRYVSKGVHVKVIDIGKLINRNIFSKIPIFLYLMSVYLFYVFLLRHKSIISSNPKLILFLCSKNSKLFIGDPIVNDISREDTFSMRLLNYYILSKRPHIITTSCMYTIFLQNKGLVAKTFKRKSIHNLSDMLGENKILYLGDFYEDRDLSLFIDVFCSSGKQLDLFGDGVKYVHENLYIHNRININDLVKIIPKYEYMVIFMNKSGMQVPGKYYDFSNAPFKCIIIYESELIENIELFDNYIYCKNDLISLKKLYNEIYK